MSTALVLSLLALGGPAPAPALELWLYQATNLLVDANVEKLETLWRRAAAAGYRKVLLADSKFARLGDLDARYFKNLARVKALAAGLKLEVVPALFSVGYSNNMLWHDPNLAEGLPVKDALFVVKGGEARLEADPPVSLDGKWDWHDEAVRLEDGVAALRDPRGNARLVRKLRLPRFRAYHVSVEVETREFTGEPRIQALAQGKPLQFAGLGVKRTQDWKEHHAVFNTLENEEVSLYLGVWGDAQGTLRWRNWRLEEAGLANVLRRPGAPCVVKDGEGRVLEEGKDYQPIRDPHLGNRPWNGEYEPWHEPPPIRTGLPDGARLRVSWYHPAVIHEGQVMCCPSEPRTMELLRDEARRVREAWGTSGYMMSHDEIRTLNWDESCRRRGLEAGAIVAGNVRECAKLLLGDPLRASTVHVWSDMFDPHHNAVKDYYLVRGDLAGSWEGLRPEVVIVNWNFGKRAESLRFFAGRGHRQVIAGYYDGPPAEARKWLEAARGVEGVIGIMYTTWRNGYGDLEEFARICREGAGKEEPK